MIWGVFNVCLVFVCARESFVVCGTMRLVFVVVWLGFLVCPVLHFHVRYKKILTDVWCNQLKQLPRIFFGILKLCK